MMDEDQPAELERLSGLLLEAVETARAGPEPSLPASDEKRRLASPVSS